jgi:hypothetical protein
LSRSVLRLPVIGGGKLTFSEGGSLKRGYDGTERIRALLGSVIKREREPHIQPPAAAPSTAVLFPIFSPLSLSIPQVIVTSNI